MRLKSVIFTAVAMALMPVGSAFALDMKAYDAAAFKAAQAAGKSVVIDVSAPWCPTCKAQSAVLDGLSKVGAYEGVTVYKVDFDSQEKVWKSFGARSQSTLIAFSGTTETGRIAGETGAAKIEALVKSSLTK